ncbi:MAG: hypothetical protein HQL54_04475 [Magnetococcales bacterium]|nr:hypothetical protein [Magnetococcales bacterium]
MRLNESAQSRYKSLQEKRQPFLHRAQEMAAITLPSLMPPDGYQGNQKLPEPYNGLGARCVIQLASRLMTALLPPGQHFFSLNVPPDYLVRAGQTALDKDTEQGLALAEKSIHAEIEKKQWRQPTHIGLQHLVVTGNVLEQMMPDNRIRVFRLDQYVLTRDPSGEILEIVVEEHVHPANMPENLLALAGIKQNDRTTVPIYTHVRKTKQNQWDIYQEIQEQKIPQSQGSYRINPFNALRWSAVVGEDYGRSKCEEHQGDLRALEALSKAMLDGAAMASRNIMGVRPNSAGGMNLRRKLAKASNGDIVVFNPEDVTMLQFQNTAGLQITQSELMRISREVGAAFLLGSALTRSAERVTATELRQNAEELESALGGVFSSLAEEMQYARIRRLLLQMQAQTKLPEWPADLVEPTIITGLEALGRERDLQRINMALQFSSQLPQEIQPYVKWSLLLGRAFNALGLGEVVQTEHEREEKRQEETTQMTETLRQAGIG